MQVKSFKIWVTVALLALLTNIALASPQIYPIGTTLYDPSKAYSGFTIIDIENPAEFGTYAKLIDMNGNEVKRWNTHGMPTKVLPNGNILTSIGRWNGSIQDIYAVQIRDFEDKVIWEFRDKELVSPIEGEPLVNGKTPIARQHHDLQSYGFLYHSPEAKYDPEANILILGHRNVMNEKINKNVQLLDDVIYELDKDKNIIWEFSFSDNFEQFGFSEEAIAAMQAYNRPITKEGQGFGWLHLNSAAYLGENKWYDAGDERFNPHNIIFNSREASFFGIIDYKTKKIVWQVGPSILERPEDAKIGQTVGEHAVHMIPKGLAGAGNILLFDNGGLSGYGKINKLSSDGINDTRNYYSRVLEIDPSTKEIVWQYRYSQSPQGKKRIGNHFDQNFFSPYTSIAQRLPNGNTVITEGDSGRIFEVTAEKETVWEYVNPEMQTASIPIYRTYRVPYSYFEGKIAKPTETAVTPPNRLDFVLPDAKGNIAKTIAK